MASNTTTTASASGAEVSGATIASTLAQPVINAIQAQISAFLPSGVASAVISQFSGGSTGGGSGSSSSTGGASLGQQTINSFLSDVNAFLPSGLASAISSQFGSAQATFGQGSATLHFTIGAPPVLTFGGSSDGGASAM